MNRRQLIKGIGAALCAGAIPTFLPSLLSSSSGCIGSIMPTDIIIDGFRLRGRTEIFAAIDEIGIDGIVCFEV